MFVFGGGKGQVRRETSSFGGETLVEAGDRYLFSYRKGRSDMGAVYIDVL